MPLSPRTVFARPLLTACLLASLPASAGDKVTITVDRGPAASSPASSPAPTASPFAGARPSVDLAILLDTSNSMDGLIDQARRQLWTIVGQFADAKKAGQTPLLRVALFEYGNSGLPATEGYLRQVVPLTDDLDVMSEALFALTTRGGDEYCGQVIDEAVTRLDWSDEPGGYKTIFIAGNEPFNQGGVDYRSACKRAIEHGVVVNTVHCGAYDTGVSGEWNLGARLAEGESLNIDQDRVVVDIPSPHDKLIIELNTELNATYLWYGKGGGGYGANQEAQDRNAAGLGSSTLVERAAAKSSAGYGNVGRDLVDSVAADAEVLSRVSDADLPEGMAQMTADERAAFVEEKARERAALRTEIQALSDQRDAYVAAERQRLAEDSGAATLGDAVTQAVAKQLARAGFEKGAPQ